MKKDARMKLWVPASQPRSGKENVRLPCTRLCIDKLSKLLGWGENKLPPPPPPRKGNGEHPSSTDRVNRRQRLMETILKIPSATLNVCLVEGKIKPLEQVFHFLVSFLIRESSLTALGRQERM